MTSSSAPYSSNTSEVPPPSTIAALAKKVATSVKLGLQVEEIVVLPQVLISLSFSSSSSSFSNDPYLGLGLALLSDPASSLDHFLPLVKED